MQVHDLGYRAWSGTRTAPFRHWSPIVTTGIRLAWQSRFLKRLLVLAWIPVLYVAGVLVVIEWVMLQQGAGAVAGALPAVTDDPAQAARLAALAVSEPAAFRGELWARLMHIYFRTPQPLVMALIVGLVAPPLISKDLRSRAWLIYFSRPISPLGYMVGKCAVVAAFLVTITTLPALFVYVLGIALSPTAAAMLTTWTLPVRIVGASLVLIVPTTMLAVCLSSLWYNSRTSTFAWYAIWIVGAIVFWILTAAAGVMANAGGEPGVPLADGTSANPAFILFSFYHMLGAAQAWIFGIEARSPAVTIGLVGLAVITVVAGTVLFRRISAPMRI